MPSPTLSLWLQALETHYEDQDAFCIRCKTYLSAVKAKEEHTKRGQTKQAWANRHPELRMLGTEA